MVVESKLNLFISFRGIKIPEIKQISFEISIFYVNLGEVSSIIGIHCSIVDEVFFEYQKAPGTCNKRRPDLSKMKLKNVDKNIAETILNEILDTGPTVTFKDVGKYTLMIYMHTCLTVEKILDI